jgi:hypothetical protein
MSESAARPFRLGCFDVWNGSVAAADESLPLVVVVEAGSGLVQQVLTWPVSPRLRGRRTALDVLLTEDSIMIASPAGGGVIRFDRRSGDRTLIALDADVAALTGSGDDVWAVAQPDAPDSGELDADDSAADLGEPLAVGGGRTRPVVWEGPTDAELARAAKTRGRQWPAGASPADVPGWSLAELRREEGDTVEVDPPAPVWRIRGGAVQHIDADLAEPRLAAVAGTIVGVGQLPEDPLVKHVGPGGNEVSYYSPGSIVVLDAAGTVRRAGPVASTDGVICADRGRVWLLGFDRDTDRDGHLAAGGVRELILPDGRIGARRELGLQQPAGIIDGLVADLCWLTPTDDPYGLSSERTVAVRLLPLDGGEPAQLPLPGLDLSVQATVRDGRVWISQQGEARLTVVTPGDPAPRELRITLDCRPWMPRPEPPDGLDLREFEDGQLDRFRAELQLVTAEQRRQDVPELAGLAFDVIELRGSFPDSQLVALFHSADQPAVQFGRRRSLYDDLGNAVRHQWADIYFEEDIISSGLPGPADCTPDQAGVVWV